MPDRIHPKLAQDQRPFFGQILQPKQIPLELELIVQVNIEAKEIDILRQQILGRRIGGVGEEGVGIDLASDSNQMLDKLGDPPDA